MPNLTKFVDITLCMTKTNVVTNVKPLPKYKMYVDLKTIDNTISTSSPYVWQENLIGIMRRVHMSESMRKTFDGLNTRFFINNLSLCIYNSEPIMIK